MLILVIACDKGPLISKCLFGIFNSPKKRTKKFDFTTIVPQVELFSFVFWENLRHQKTFKNKQTFSSSKKHRKRNQKNMTLQTNKTMQQNTIVVVYYRVSVGH